MKLNIYNYHSQEAKKEFLSASRYKTFLECEERAIAEQGGEWTQEPTEAMLVSSYIDAYFSNNLDKFKEMNPDIFKKNGDLRSSYCFAHEIINRIQQDSYFMKYLSGEKQTILTAEMFGALWSIAIDSYIPGEIIVDLKVMRELRKKYYSEKGPITFIEAFGYDIQLAIYQEIVRICTGDTLAVFIAGASKEKEPDIEIIHIDQDRLDECLEDVKNNMGRISSLKEGKEKPKRCERCSYCKKTKILLTPINYKDLI